MYVIKCWHLKLNTLIVFSHETQPQCSQVQQFNKCFIIFIIRLTVYFTAAVFTKVTFILDVICGLKLDIFPPFTIIIYTNPHRADLRDNCSECLLRETTGVSNWPSGFLCKPSSSRFDPSLARWNIGSLVVNRNDKLASFVYTFLCLYR